MTLDQIKEYVFKDTRVQADWDDKAPICYKEMLGWIKEVKNETPKNDPNWKSDYIERLSHALCRLADIRTECQDFVDVAYSEHAIDKMQLTKGELEGKAKFVQGIIEAAISAPNYLLACSINFSNAIEHRLTALEAMLKWEKRQP